MGVGLARRLGPTLDLVWELENSEYRILGRCLYGLPQLLSYLHYLTLLSPALLSHFACVLREVARSLDSCSCCFLGEEKDGSYFPDLLLDLDHLFLHVFDIVRILVGTRALIPHFDDIGEVLIVQEPHNTTTIDDLGPRFAKLVPDRLDGSLEILQFPFRGAWVFFRLWTARGERLRGSVTARFRIDAEDRGGRTTVGIGKVDF